MLQFIAGTAANRLSMNQKGEVSFNTDGLDLSKNEGANLINDLVNVSDNLYGLTIGTSVETAGGPLGVDDTMNLPSAFDQRPVRPGALGLPKSPFDDQVAVNPNVRLTDTQNLQVLTPSLVFHELAEAYSKIDQGLPYENHPIMTVVNNTVQISMEGPTGAHYVAVQREIQFREQRPNVESTGRAGDSLVRDPHN